MAIADGAGDLRQVSVGRIGLPGEQKIVLGAVGLGEADLHPAGSTSTAVP
jgi:hypothetical protein